MLDQLKLYGDNNTRECSFRRPIIFSSFRQNVYPDYFAGNKLNLWWGYTLSGVPLQKERPKCWWDQTLHFRENSDFEVYKKK